MLVKPYGSNYRHKDENIVISTEEEQLTHESNQSFLLYAELVIYAREHEVQLSSAGVRDQPGQNDREYNGKNFFKLSVATGSEFALTCD